MKFDELAILLNCCTFQDFPTHATDEDADSLLAHWTALWHPALVAGAGRMPTWYRADVAPPHDRPRLFSLPRNQFLASPDIVQRDIGEAGGCLVKEVTSREAFFAELERQFPDAPLPPVADDLAADFFALGYAYLQVELLTRQMRHATRLCETAFETQLVEASRAALAGDASRTRELLQACFDFLSQERDHYYAVDVYLVDLSLVAPPFCGQGLRDQLAAAEKSNLLLPAELLAHLELHEPETLAAMRAALDEQRLGLVGGEYASWPLQLLSTETARGQLAAGRAEYQRVLGQSPRVYGRHRFGLNPSLPPLLIHFGFTGAYHATFDGGRFPEGSQSKSRWEGDGQTGIDAILRAPLDASQPGTFLAFGASVGESMDMDHIATRALVHWAGQLSPWYRDLRRASYYTRALGRFVRVEDYFQDTYDPGLHDRFAADDYRSPYLQEPPPETRHRPISAIVDYWRQHQQLQSWCHLAVLGLVLFDTPAAREAYERAQQRWLEWTRRPLDPSWNERLSDVAAETEAAARHLADFLKRPAGSGAAGAANVPSSSTSAPENRLLLNPLSFPRRMGPLSIAQPPDSQPPVYALEEEASSTAVIADVPSMGFAQLRPSREIRKRAKATPKIAESEWLRNEFLEAKIDPETGGLRGIKDYASRAHRLSQQLAYRWLPPSPYPGGYYTKPEPLYSRMVGESLKVIRADSLVGCLETRGRLVDEQQKTLARFTQAFRLARGSRVLEIEIELQPEVLPDGEPWDNYYASRVAWSNEACDLHRSLADGRRSTKARTLESPLFVQIEDGQQSSVIVTGGLAFHRAVGSRMLDTLLLVKNEPARTFRLGIALDPKQPFREALAFLSPEIQLPLPGPPLATDSAWMFHVDARHVLVTSWWPLWENDRVAGVRLRLLELEGRTGAVLIRSYRPIAEARKVDSAGQTVQPCNVDAEGLRVTVAGHEPLEIEARFAS